MADFYTNLPPKDKDQLDKTIEKLTNSDYQTEYEFNAGEYDAAIGFFVRRGFSRTSAESTAYVIMSQAKIDNVNPQELLDKLGHASEIQLSEVITIILNANRYKSSRLGVRQSLTTTEVVSRNILD
mgnify:CR=1 FL=1|jgi:hypothetical protein|tara:strand:+ start:269 stop:646 length:378 start_codon:yes stop_codon:yes gene_type:complete